jgi:hypothetical protein
MEFGLQIPKHKSKNFEQTNGGNTIEIVPIQVRLNNMIKSTYAAKEQLSGKL